MRNGITITKRAWLNKHNYANFELFDGDGKGCLITVHVDKEKGKTIICLDRIDKGIKVVASKKRDET